MSDVQSQLSTLSSSPGAAAPPRSRWLTFLFPAAIVLGFALLFLLLFRDRLLPATDVRVAPAIAVEDATAKSMPSATSGRLLFQASGWIEPDPLPIKATALIDGFVDQVHVLEGQSVKKGDPLATLVTDDTRIALESAKADEEMAKAEFDAHCVLIEITMEKLHAEQALLETDQANADEAADRLRRLEQSAASSIELDRINARFESSRRRSALVARQAKIKETNHEVIRLGHEAVAMRAKATAATAMREKAALDHSRTKITAPADGRVFRLAAAPGEKKMLNMDEMDSSTIAILYDPAHLQVRVDVPLADAAGLGVGQKAKVRCNLLPDHVFAGEVTRITGEADLQRNTLQAKVRITDPDDRLRPEMICRVEFLETATASSAQAAPTSTAIAVYVPETALSGDTVWICDPDTKRAAKRQVTPSVSRENLRRIDQGILPGEWVVLNPGDLREGQRLNPVTDR